MKYLQDYQENKQSELFESTGAFFAFSDTQFNESKKEGIVYTICGSGLICPKSSSKTLLNGLGTIYKESIEQDIKENGKVNIIIRELYNYESFYTGDIDQVFDALKHYGFSIEDIQKAYNSEYPNADI